MVILKVYIANSNLKINKTFFYLSNEQVDIFTRVKVNFANRITLGFVEDKIETVKDIEELEKEYGYKLKYIQEVIDEKAIINHELYSLAKWLSKVSVAPFISCINVMLPSILKTKSNKINVSKEYFVVLGPNDNHNFTVKQKAVYEDFKSLMPYSEFLEKYKSVGKKLLALNVFEKIEKNKKYNDLNTYQQENFKNLTPEQFLAYQKFNDSKKLVNLLFGVTGSGKTEVYLHLARDILKQHKQVLILVPEIGLTPQMIKRVRERFENICVYHSKLNNQERFYQYNRVLNNEVDIVIGTRSAIFLPFKKLGLIIVDEEHDHSYIQENQPSYDTKNIVIKRALTHKCKVLLASATPSLKVFTRAKAGEYQLIELNKRINNLPLKITMENSYKNIKQGESYIIGDYLKKRMFQELEKGNQIILLLNKRGYISYSSCNVCFQAIKCRHCDIALVYHNDERVYKCHHCCRIYPRNIRCTCGGDLAITNGFGTKKVEELCKNLFKDIEISRYDYDSTRFKGAHEKILNDFEQGKIRILIGTQMIAKGLDFPKVTLVGILDGDTGILRDNYRANEDCFNLLMQASGRSGRGLSKGEVVIQTMNPDHIIFKAIQKQDYEMFYNYEIEYRKTLRQPPFVNMAAIELKDKNIKRLDNSKKIFSDLLKKYSITHLNPMQLTKLNDLNRVRFVIIDTKVKDLLDNVNKTVDEYLVFTNLSSILVQINPVRL